MSFDEKGVLTENCSYFARNLDVPMLKAVCSEEAPEERIKEECVPGQPYITFVANFSEFTTTPPE